MTKDQAREILEDWINNETMSHGDGVISDYGHIDILLPITDEVIYSKMEGGNLTQWTFKGLIKIAYDL